MPPSAQTNCPNCGTALTFPYGSVYIQCPSCTYAFNPQPPPMPPQPIVQQAPPQHHNAVNYINCLQCQALLSYAPTSVTIQCPKVEQQHTHALYCTAINAAQRTVVLRLIPSSPLLPSPLYVPSSVCSSWTSHRLERVR